MGIYEDIQNDLGEALDGDLNDAYLSFVVVEMVGDPVYDQDTRTYAYLENPQNCNGVDLSELQGERFDHPDVHNVIEILVLDKDKPFDFKIGQRIEMKTRNYKISGIESDPAGSTWTISGRTWGK